MSLTNTPRFSKLFNSALGSPFLTTSDLPSLDGDSVSISTDVNANDHETNHNLEAIDGAFATVPRGYTITRPPSPSPSFRTETYSIVNWSPNDYNDLFPSMDGRPSISDAAPGCSMPFRTMPYPRNAYSPFQSSSSYHPYSNTPYNTIRFPPHTPTKPIRSLASLTKIWEALRESSPHRKGKRRFDAACASIWQEIEGDGYIDYSNLPPLDGEEFELIDDEACFIDVRAVTGVGGFPLHIMIINDDICLRRVVTFGYCHTQRTRVAL